MFRTGNKSNVALLALLIGCARGSNLKEGDTCKAYYRTRLHGRPSNDYFTAEIMGVTKKYVTVKFLTDDEEHERKIKELSSGTMRQVIPHDWVAPPAPKRTTAPPPPPKRMTRRTHSERAMINLHNLTQQTPESNVAPPPPPKHVTRQDSSSDEMTGRYKKGDTILTKYHNVGNAKSNNFRKAEVLEDAGSEEIVVKFDAEFKSLFYLGRSKQCIPLTWIKGEESSSSDSNSSSGATRRENQLIRERLDKLKMLHQNVITPFVEDPTPTGEVSIPQIEKAAEQLEREKYKNDFLHLTSEFSPTAGKWET